MSINNESRCPIRSAWPSIQYGKLLTDRRIAFYEKQGRYVNGIVKKAEDFRKPKTTKRQAALSERKRLLALYQ